jgi:hypothetical protein
MPTPATQPRHLCARGFSLNKLPATTTRQRKGLCRNRHAEKKMIVTMSSKEVLKRRAEARFKQEARALDGRKAMTEYEAQVLAIREKTARLRALRLAKEAQAQNEEPPPKTNVRPIKKPQSIIAL